MRLSLHVPNFTWPGGPSRMDQEFAAIVERAEEAGLYSLWTPDHCFQAAEFGPPEREMLEG